MAASHLRLAPEGMGRSLTLSSPARWGEFESVAARAIEKAL